MPSSIDETLVAAHLRVPRELRIQAFEHSYGDLRKLALAAAQSRDELA